MPVQRSIIAGLDIGTSSIKVVIGEKRVEGGIDIIGVGSSSSRGLRKGVVINIESTVSSIARAIAQAETMAGCEVQSVLASISGNHIKSLNSDGIVGIKNREVSHADIERVVEAAKAVAIPLDREILHVLPQEFVIDEQDGVRDPIGISGVRMEARVHIITGAIASAQNIVKCANRCGLTVQDIVAAPLASARAVLSQEEQELGVCLIDIGGGTCGITVFQGGGVRFTSVIAVGGSHISNDIAAGLRTPIVAAEKIKCDFGTAIKSRGGDDSTIEVTSTGGRPARVLSKYVLTEIIEPRVVEIFGLIQSDLLKAGCEGHLTSGIVLTGGGSQLPGIAQVAEQVFNLPVRVGSSICAGGLVDLIRSPEYAVAVGLVQHGALQQNQIKHQGRGGFLGRAMSTVTGWFSEHF